MFGVFFTEQVLFDGVVNGFVFGLLAMGVVLVYRATKVINFAVGNMGMIGGGLLAMLVEGYGAPFWLSVVLALAAGTLFGGLVELTVIRRLFNAPRVIVLVATIGIAQLCQAILAAFPKVTDAGLLFPRPVGSAFEIGSVRVGGPQVVILVIVPIVAVALTLLLTRTTLGKTVTASAENRDLSRLAGINPKLVSTAVWAIAGALATLSLSLLAGQANSASALASLGPLTLVRALAAAVIAGMTSFTLAFGAGIALGVLQGLVSFNFLDQAGLVDFLLLVAVVIAVWFQSRQGGEETKTFSFAAKRRPVSERLQAHWWARNLDRLGLVALGLLAATVPLIIDQPSRLLLYTTIIAFGVCAMSVTVLTG